MNLISDENFEKWKEQRNIEGDVLFSTKNSYIGLCFRSRPGAFYLTDKELVHWSYSPRDCAMAAFEKEVKITIPIDNISIIRIEKLPFLWRMISLGAKWVVKVETSNLTKEIILYEKPDLFSGAINKLGLQCV